MLKKSNSTTTSLTIYQPMKYRLFYFLLSAFVILPGIYSLVRYGFRLSIDFTGGSVISFTSTQLQPDYLQQTLTQLHIEPKQIDHQNNFWRLTISPIDQSTFDQLINHLRSQAPDIKLHEFYTVGALLGKELIKKTIYGLTLAASLILFYIAIRFRNLKFGISAILAMLHDTLVLLGSFSLLGHFYGIEVDSLFVTAVLTILSFSVHDTIVVYDRIRELKKHHPHLDFEEVVNRAVVETLGRSINNSMTIIFMLLAMYLMGGATIHNFILALLVGTISGTYSSTFTAAPLLATWHQLSHRRSRA